MSLAPALTAGRAELEAFCRSRAAGIPYGDGRVLCRILGDYPVFVAAADLMLGPRLVLDGFWEAWVTRALARYLQPGAWCIDVGANYGYYTLLMAAAVGPGGRVLVCEPNPLLAGSYLPRNVALNGFRDRVEICPRAIGDTDGAEVDFALHDQDFATSSLARWACPHRSETVRVPTATLDSLCAGWPRLDLVKIDAEGAEGLVWAGMQQVLRRFPEAVVVIELHFDRDPAGVAELLRSLEASRPPRFIDYGGEVASTDVETILANTSEHWTLWSCRDTPRGSTASSG